MNNEYLNIKVAYFGKAVYCFFVFFVAKLPKIIKMCDNLTISVKH